jgi:hypothetical protein
MPNNTPPPLYNAHARARQKKRQREMGEKFIFQWLYTTSLYKFCRASSNSAWFSAAKRRLLLLAAAKLAVGLFLGPAAGAVVVGVVVVVVVVAQPPPSFNGEKD